MSEPTHDTYIAYVIYTINCGHPNDIYILNCREVDNKFNSRFSAVKREYEYRLSNIYSPINQRYIWHVKEKLNLKKLNEFAHLILGEHDFTQLSKKNEEIDINFQKLGPNKFYYDVIYNPKETMFLKKAKQQGNIAENGIMMFVYQAHQAFTIWHKVMPKIDEETLKLITK